MVDRGVNGKSVYGGSRYHLKGATTRPHACAIELDHTIECRYRAWHVQFDFLAIDAALHMHLVRLP